MPLLKDTSGRNNSAVALLLIDVINDLDFDQADDLLAHLPMARKIATLKTRSCANPHRFTSMTFRPVEV
jgi:hypothetical protein